MAAGAVGGSRQMIVKSFELTDAGDSDGGLGPEICLA